MVIYTPPVRPLLKQHKEQFPPRAENHRVQPRSVAEMYTAHVCAFHIIALHVFLMLNL